MVMRCAVLAFSCCLAAVAAAQDTSAPVTYSTRAARLSEVLKGLGQATKVNLQTTPKMGSEVIIVSASGQSLTEIMSRIATVTSGEWKQEGEIYRLVPNQPLRLQEERTELANKTSEIRKAIAGRLKEQKQRQAALDKLKAKQAAQAKAGDKSKAGDKVKGDAVVDPTDQSNEDMFSFGGAGAEENSITQLLVGLDPSVLAQIELGDRLVFSSNPTRSQRSLGGDATDIINSFIQVHNAQVAKTPQADLDSNDLGQISSEQADMIRNMMKKRNSKIGQVAKALMVVKRAGRFSFGLEIQLRLYDAKGSVVFSADSNLNPGSDFSSFGMGDVATKESSSGDDGDDKTVTTVTPQKVQPAPAKGTPIEYSEDSKAFISATKRVTAGNFKISMSQDLRRKMFQPSLYDPISFTQTDELLAYAKSIKKPLVADVSDDWQTSGMGLMGTDVGSTVESVTKDLMTGSTLSVVPDTTFAVVKPSRPAHARSIRMDRMALTNLLRATDEKGVPSLDDMAEYAMHLASDSTEGIATTYLALFVPGGMLDMMGGGTDWGMLRFYGHLSTEARSTLAGGGKIPFASLSSDQKAELDKMTYGADSQLMIEDPQHKSTDDDGPSWLHVMDSMFKANGDYREEPTELLPSGLPSDGYVELTMKKESFASPQGSGGDTMVAMLGVLGPDEMALFTMLKSTKGAEQVAGMLPSFGKLKIGEMSVLHFTFHLAPLVSVKQTLHDHRFGNNAPIVAENGLPADFQKQIDDRMAALKKTPFANFGAFGGGVVHP